MRAHSPSVNAVASRYIRAFLERQAVWRMDSLARLSILEGAAGVPPGTWLAMRERGFAAALDHFGPNLAASWTSASDRGLYDQAVSVANHTLRNTSSMDGEELVQDLITFSSSASGPKRQKVFYAIGESLSTHDRSLSDGKITPESALVRGRLVHWVENAARDVLRTKHVTLVRPFSSQPGAEMLEGTQPLSNEQRESLMLLALQSPGGPGSQLRRSIDGLIDRHFKASERAVVRLFLEKISHPKYRSPEMMRETVDRFVPSKWFKQAYNVVRREIMDATGMSPQQLTNILGGDAVKVFHFMTQVVGKDAGVRALLDDLAEEIELLEPNDGHRLASAETQEVLTSLLQGLPLKQIPQNIHSEVRDYFEKDQIGDWNRQTQPLTEFSRGPSELRVANRWLRTRSC